MVRSNSEDLGRYTREFRDGVVARREEGGKRDNMDLHDVIFPVGFQIPIHLKWDTRSFFFLLVLLCSLLNIYSNMRYSYFRISLIDFIKLPYIFTSLAFPVAA